MSIIGNPEKSKRLGKQLFIFAIAILILLLFSYLIPQSWIQDNPALVYSLYYGIPIFLFAGVFLLIKRIERG